MVNGIMGINHDPIIGLGITNGTQVSDKQIAKISNLPFLSLLQD
jgi:hypothetical protein